MNFHRHAITLLAALLLSTAAPRLYAQVRVAVVDLQRALTETEDGRRAKARLKRLFKRRQDELDTRQGELKALKEDLDKQLKVLSEERRQERIEAYQKAFIELQSTYVEYQRELAEKESEYTQRIVARMQRIIQRLGQTEGYTLILDRSSGGVMWVPGNLDLTDDLIQRYNAGEGRDGESAAPRDDDEAPSGGSGTKAKRGAGARGSKLR